MKTAIVDGEVIQVNDSDIVMTDGAEEIIKLIRKVQFEYSGLALSGKDLEPTARAKIKQAAVLIKQAERGYISGFKNTDKVTKERQLEAETFEREQTKRGTNRLGVIGTLASLGDASADKIRPLVVNTQRLIVDLNKAANSFFAIFGKGKIRTVITEVEKALKLLRQAQAIQAKVR